MHILTKIELFDLVENDHIEAIDDIPPYHSTPPSPTSQATKHVSDPKLTRTKMK